MALRTMLSQNSVRDFYALYRFLEVDYEGIIDLKVFYAKVYGKGHSGPVLPGSPRRIYEVHLHVSVCSHT